MKTLPPVLLTMPDYCGTLAAARCLGSAGVPVWMAGTSLRSPAMHSRYVGRRLLSPPYREGEAWAQWLLDLGRREPGLVLYPTSDDLAWLMALHAERLAPYFRLWAPTVDVYERLLDKALLDEACRAVGLETPYTLAPIGPEAVREAIAKMPLPALIKQRTQVLSLTNDKGVLVHERAKLAGELERFRQKNRHAAAALARMPNASEPLLQQYFPEGVSGSLQVSGFIDESGELFVARAANKVLQRPKTLGISLCLEATALDPELAQKVRALCRKVGYFGVFGIEFLQVGGRPLLIDFNPRYYHYLALDIARGMPTPVMTAFAATGQREKLERLVRAAQQDPEHGARGFTYALQLNELLVAQTLVGTMSPRESLKWWQWKREHEGALVDAMDDPFDRRPYLVDVASTMAYRARHPLRFLRRIAFDA